MKTTLRLALLATLFASAAHAQLVVYNADQTAPNIGAVTTLATNVNATAFALNNVTLGRIQVTGSNHAATITPTVAQTSVDLATTLENATYFSITLTPAAGYSLNLTSISFLANAGGAASPRGFAVFSSVDGYTTGAVLSSDNNGAGGTLTARGTQTPYSASLVGSSYQNITGVTEFRFYVQGNTGQAIDFDNITVNGTVSAIPEPASFAAVAGGLLLIGATCTRRRRDVSRA